MPAQCSLCVKSLFLSQLVFQRKGSFFLSWIYLEALAWPKSSVCHCCLFPFWHVHLQDFVPITVRSLTSGWRTGKQKHSAEEHNCCGSWHIPQKNGLISGLWCFLCLWLLIATAVSMVQSQVDNETFWIPSGTWSSLDLLDQRFRARYWDPCLVLSWVSGIKGSLSEKE